MASALALSFAACSEGQGLLGAAIFLVGCLGRGGRMLPPSSSSLDPALLEKPELGSGVSPKLS